MDRYSFFSDDENNFIPQYKFGDKIENDKFKSGIQNPLFVNYKYIQIVKTDYHFSQDIFDNKDIVTYFRFMKMLSSVPFIKLINNKQKDWHLYSSDYKGILKRIVNESFEVKILREECIPTFYHFALYTNENSSRKSNIKSPRIYFFIGDNATIYPLFYDPYHEINP